MEDKKEIKERLVVFLMFFVFAFVLWRLVVLFVYQDGGVSLFREMTGLKIHHYHWGLAIVLVASFLLVFDKRNRFVFGLLGFGLGSALDSSLSFLLKTSVRKNEIATYNLGLLPSVFFFSCVVLIGMICYLLVLKKSEIDL